MSHNDSNAGPGRHDPHDSRGKNVLFFLDSERHRLTVLVALVLEVRPLHVIKGQVQVQRLLYPLVRHLKHMAFAMTTHGLGH